MFTGSDDHNVSPSLPKLRIDYKSGHHYFLERCDILAMHGTAKVAGNVAHQSLFAEAIALNRHLSRVYC
jgi:hypothetical protein